MDETTPKRRWYRKKRWWAAGMLWLAVAYPVTLVLAHAALPEDRGTAEGLASVRDGMTDREVNRLLGGEPDFIGTVAGRVSGESGFDFTRPGDGREYGFHQWNSPRQTTVVIFDDGGRSVHSYGGAGQRVPLARRLLRLWRGPEAIP